MLFANEPGLLSGGFYVPQGNEFGEYTSETTQWEDPDWMVLTDNNRKELSFSFDRIEQRKRMINGRMRSVHVADKLKLSISWDMIPSRAFDIPQTSAYAQSGADAGRENSGITKYTTDGGAGGADMLKWYEDHPGPFWVLLSYDNFHQYDNTADPWSNMPKYSEQVEMYFESFDYQVVKRGQLYDHWNASLSLEEV